MATGDLERELARLQAENGRLLRLLGLTAEQARPPVPSQAGLFLEHPGMVTAASTPQQKVAFFRAMFAARDDVYAIRWENARSGKSGWVPAVAGGWRKGANRPRLRLGDDVVAAHLSGRDHIGLYPLMPGDTCRWLAADFDGPAAMLDALAYLKAARAAGVPAALEVSRSGIGAHVWIFFSGTVPAASARALGMGLLREAIAVRGRIDLRSYDRLFPSQDVLPSSGGIGNLIAAPLHGQARKDGATVFLDLGTLEPHEDQWAYLSGMHRLSSAEVTRLAGRVGAVKVGGAVESLAPAMSTRTRPRSAAVVGLRLRAGCEVAVSELTPAALGTLKHAASMNNPLFGERQRRRLSTWNVPRFLLSYDETMDGRLVLPRGLGERVISVLEEAGSRVEIADERSDGDSHGFELAATLREDQAAAVSDLAAHDLGVLVAEPGAGKTVMGCALIAEHGVATLILVDRKALADQWRSRIRELLGVRAGQLGAGRSSLRGVVDVVTLQTLARRQDVAELTSGYGLVLVDECHHLPAAAFENAVRQIRVKRWVGLTATPYRRDGLDELIHHQLGPIRHTVTPPPAGTLGAAEAPERQLAVHPTSYEYLGDADPSKPGGMAAIYRDLAANETRTVQVVGDVLEALGRGRNCLVLTQWKSHVETLAARLREEGQDPVVLRGGMGARERKAALARLEPGPAPLLVVATGPYVGEGFDCPALDALFLAAPIAFKGRLVQFVGRVLRPHPGKTTAEVHDYHDEQTAVLASSLAKRAPGYRALGFPNPREVILAHAS
ncbi:MULTISPECIES: DEAD/DEAH box helicase [unclassified Pseudonocardia]|uniref:DEAD/DEAH box helicase n=1 Tax=unclassified Pseudonocardia TaxID=2619320 RepID=UPI001CF66086|nr:MULTISPECIES: DEAD/DEAH box helicase [unclassified Pseudonocardia]